MKFKTLGNRKDPAVLFFHAMGVTGAPGRGSRDSPGSPFPWLRNTYRIGISAFYQAYHCGHYPVFEGYDHMQYQIRDPKGFAEMLAYIAEHDGMPKLPFIRKCEDPI